MEKSNVLAGMRKPCKLFNRKSLCEKIINTLNTLKVNLKKKLKTISDATAPMTFYILKFFFSNT